LYLAKLTIYSIAVSAMEDAVNHRSCPKAIITLALLLLAVSSCLAALPADMLANIVLSDKKRNGDTINLIIPVEIGRCCIYPVPAADIPDWIAKGLA
jgi:3-dehydroquinate synthetase